MPGATLSRYLWFGLVSGPAPKFQTVLRRDEIPPEVLALEGFGEILSNYYQEQKHRPALEAGAADLRARGGAAA